MRKTIFSTILFLVFIILVLVSYLTFFGHETDKFNNFISDKAIQNNKNISLKLEKVKFKFDVKDFNLFVETKNPELIYKDLEIPIENVKVYLDFYSLIKSDSKIDKMNISSKEININQLKEIIIKTKPSNLNSLITNKIKNGKLFINLELYFFVNSLNETPGLINL